MLKRSLALIGVLALVVLAAACGRQKAAAEAAVASADTAFGAIQAEAVKYVPDQAKAVADSLTATKDALAKGEYQTALTSAQALPAKITELGAAVTAKKNELTAAWTSMSASMPKMVEAIQSRIGMLAKSRKLPAGLDKAKFEEAKAGLAQMTTAWTEATTAFGAGNLTDAIAKAESVKTKATTIMATLNMQVPAAMQAVAPK